MDDDVLISKSFKLLGSEGRTALIPYVTAGYPNRDATVPLLERLKDVGADIIELGIPFSDPLADGPTIQRSSFAALENGLRLPQCWLTSGHFGMGMTSLSCSSAT